MRMFRALYREPFMVCVVICFAPGIYERNTSPYFIAALVAAWGASWFADKIWQAHLDHHPHP